MQITIENLLEKSGKDISSYPKLLVYPLLKKLLHINTINSFLENHKGIDGIHFIDEVFEYLNFKFKISNIDLSKIPAEGRLIVVANHPLGALDSLALIKAISIVRKDIKIISNDLLSFIPNLDDLLIHVGVFNNSFSKKKLLEIEKALDKEKALIIFPAGEVSRIKGINISDSKWKKSPIKLSRKKKAPILPVYIKGKNSFTFYATSFINKNLSSLLLINEIFNKKKKEVELIVGEPISQNTFQDYIDSRYCAKLLKKHVYKLGKGKKGIFRTYKTVIHPVDARVIRKELRNSIELSRTKDGKYLYLIDSLSAPNTLREISRIREITFRKVGEGTWLKRDSDAFDTYYHHLVIWDDEELEIAGSYRIGFGKSILNTYGHNGFYSSKLFDFTEKFTNEILPYSLELGRSFVRSEYWNSYVLDYLWQGIGAIIANNENIKYLFGPVSISNDYPPFAKNLIITYLKKWYSPKDDYVIAKTPYNITENAINKNLELLDSNKRIDDFKKVKLKLASWSLHYPVLYKHYAEVASDDGVCFNAFNIDKDFADCLDSIILIDIDNLKPEKKKRYIDPHLQSNLINV